MYISILLARHTTLFISFVFLCGAWWCATRPTSRGSCFGVCRRLNRLESPLSLSNRRRLFACLALSAASSSSSPTTSVCANSVATFVSGEEEVSAPLKSLLFLANVDSAMTCLPLLTLTFPCCCCCCCCSTSNSCCSSKSSKSGRLT